MDSRFFVPPTGLNKHVLPAFPAPHHNVERVEEPGDPDYLAKRHKIGGMIVRHYASQLVQPLRPILGDDLFTYTVRYLSRTDTLAVLHTVCPHKDKDKMNMSRSQSANALKLALADFIITSKGNETISKAADHWLTELFSVNVFPQLAKVLSQRTARKPDDLECLMRGGHRKRFVLGPCLTDNPDEPIIASTSEHDSETTPDAPAAAQSSVTTITALEDDISPDRRRLYDLLAGLNDARIPSVIAFTERVIRANDWHGPRDEDDSTASWSLTEEEVETPRGVCSPVSPRSESISDTEAVELALPNERRTSVDDEVTVDELIELETRRA